MLPTAMISNTLNLGMHEALDTTDYLMRSLDCWAKLDTLKKPGSFKTWLVSILVNNCRDILREGSRLVVLDEVPERAPEEDDHSGLFFEELMGCLSETYRPVMTLYYAEGFRAREIAELLDIPVGTVTVRLKRGREQLREQLRKGEVPL